jgi:isopenicillin-N N-acyltransferase like protein
MRRVSCLFALPVLTLVLLAPSAPAADAPPAFATKAAEGGELRYVQGLPVLFLSGDPQQLGRQQAALVLDVARRNAGLPKVVLGRYGGGLLWPLVVGFSQSLMRDVPPRYQDEIKAAFAAAKCKPDEIDALTVANSLVELRCFGLCSAFLVEPQRSATGDMLFGRNFDVPTYGLLDRMTLVVVCRPTGRHAFASVTWAGFFGVLSGMNDAGLAIACLDSGPAKDGSTIFSLGTPLGFTFRRILEECANIEEAQKLLSGAKRTTWMNLAACDRQRAVVFEITPKSVVTRGAENHLLACTNHFRTPELGVLPKRSWRYRLLQKNWERRHPFRWPDVASALHQVNLGEETTQSMIFEPKTLRLRLSLNPPPASAGPFIPLDLAALFQQPIGPLAKQGK